MTEVTLIRYRVEPGKTDRLREWMAEVRSREDEALETLEHEGIYTETVFLERTRDDDYLVYYMEAEDVAEAFEAYESSPYELDRENQEILEEVLADEQPDGEVELLSHFERERP